MNIIQKLRREPIATIGAAVVLFQNVIVTLDSHISVYSDLANTILVIVGTIVGRAKVSPTTNLPVSIKIPSQTNAAGPENND